MIEIEVVNAFSSLGIILNTKGGWIGEIQDELCGKKQPRYDSS